VTSALTVAFTARATKQTRRALTWWRESRPAAPDLLEQELRSVLALVAAAPMLGAVARDNRIKDVRRVLLRRTRYHVYYRVQVAAGRLEVLALWHTSRRDPLL
jgi:plasmid stabilization system protein ParE